MICKFYIFEFILRPIKKFLCDEINSYRFDVVWIESKYLSHTPLYSGEFLGLAAKPNLRPAESRFQLQQFATPSDLDLGDSALCPRQPVAPFWQHALLVYFR